MLERDLVIEMAPGIGVTPPQPIDGSLKANGAAVDACAGSEIHHMIGNRDGFRLVLDHQHGITLVAQLQQKLVHVPDVMRMQADGGFIEHVGDIGQRRAQVPDHLGALRLTAGERAGRAIQGQVARTDPHERVEGVRQAVQQGLHGRVIQATDPLGKVGDLHGARIGDAHAVDRGGAGTLSQPGAVALRAGLECDGAVHELAHVGLHSLAVLVEHGFLDSRDEALKGHVDALDLDPHGLHVQEVQELLVREILDGCVPWEELEAAVQPGVPTALVVTGYGDGAVPDGHIFVVELGKIQIRDLAHALAARAHASGDGERLPLPLLAAAFHSDRAGTAHRWNIESKGLGATDVRLRQPREHNAEQRIDVRGGSHRGARVCTHGFLVHHDGGGDALQHVDIGSTNRGHHALQEYTVGFIDQPLRLCGHGTENQGALPRSGDAREHRESAFGDVQTHIPEVVLAGAPHPDQIVPVGRVLAVRIGCAHRVSKG